MIPEDKKDQRKFLSRAMQHGRIRDCFIKALRAQGTAEKVKAVEGINRAFRELQQRMEQAK